MRAFAFVFLIGGGGWFGSDAGDVVAWSCALRGVRKESGAACVVGRVIWISSRCIFLDRRGLCMDHKADAADVQAR